MAKVTSVKHIRNYIYRVANLEGISPEDAHDKVMQEYQCIAFMSIWTVDDNEVIVPNTMPVPGSRLPGMIII